MSVTPDKSALAQARERLERAYANSRPAVAGEMDLAVAVRSDLRIVLDALKDAERARHVYPSLSCNKCGQPASLTIDGICSPCYGNP